MPGAYRAAIFVPIPIEHIVMAFFTGFFDNDVSLNGKDLVDKGEVEVVVQRGGCPDRA